MSPRAKLAIGEGFSLPLDIVTDPIALIGNRGSGKSYGAARLAEQFVHAGQQVVIMDPTDAHYGLRYGADRRSEGLPVYVLGGRHADVPLESSGGKLVADLVVGSRASFVLSMRHLSKTAMRTFATDFLERLYERKGDPDLRTPMHLFVDEAHLLAPEQKAAETFRLLGAMQDVVLQGRHSGIGVSLISQRVAAVSKSVLELCEILFAFRTTGTNARKALRAWIVAHAEEEREEEFFASVASLDRGTAWAWSPGRDLFVPVRFLRRETYDSSATPEPGRRVARPGKAAQVDLAKLGEEMAATVKRAEANDPRKLRAEVERLEAEVLRSHEQIRRLEDRGPERVEIGIVPAELVDAMVEYQENACGLVGRYMREMREEAHSSVDRVFDGFAAEFAAESQRVSKIFADYTIPDPAPVTRPEEPSGDARDLAHRSTRSPDRTPEPARDRAQAGVVTQALGMKERKVLTALAQFPAGLTKAKLALLSEYSMGASTIGVALSELRRRGYVERGGYPARITDEGLRAIGPVDAPPRGPDLLSWWYERLGKKERLVAQALVDAYPDALDDEQLARITGYSIEASTIGVALSTLRKAEVVERPTTRGGPARLTDEFAEAIR